MARSIARLASLIAAIFWGVAGAQDPELGQLPVERYVDAFKGAYYDLSYRAEGGNLSTWLTIEYHDGTVIDITIYDFVEQTSSEEQPYLAMGKGYLGIGGRIFPQFLTPKTAPNLWAARQAAMTVMEQYNTEFMLKSTEVVFVAIVMTMSAARMGEPPAQPKVSRSSLETRARLRAQQVRQLPPVAGATTAKATTQLTGATHLSRNAPELGGFRAGISADEIAALNRQLGGVKAMTGHPSSALAAAAREQGFWRKVAAIVPRN